MSNEKSTIDVSGRENGLRSIEFASVELLAIGLVTIGLGGVVYAGLIPGSDGVARGLGAALVGTGVGVTGYSFAVVQGAVSLQSITLGGAFIATAVVLSQGVWAGMLVIWGGAFVAIGVIAYGYVVLSRRGTRG